jgi:hypothetical protein
MLIWIEFDQMSSEVRTSENETKLVNEILVLYEKRSFKFLSFMLVE